MPCTRMHPHAFARQRSRRRAMHVIVACVWPRRCGDEGAASNGRAARPQHMDYPAIPQTIKGHCSGHERRRAATARTSYSTRASHACRVGHTHVPARVLVWAPPCLASVHARLADAPLRGRARACFFYATEMRRAASPRTFGEVLDVAQRGQLQVCAK